MKMYKNFCENLLSYLVQVTLSASFSYQSLYEAQVPSRADSPAHYAEHLRIGLRLIGKRQLVAMPESVGSLNLVSLLASGIPLALSDDKQFLMGRLRAESPWVGQSVCPLGLVESRDDIKLVAIGRNGQILLPRHDSVLMADDELLLIISPETRAQMAEHLILFGVFDC